ncbi:MAG: hypothetical protein PQJ46_17225, partial [Spirochaetales bacterium]|nr:hypothetical protein [Spirochaetales bacterium]
MDEKKLDKHLNDFRLFLLEKTNIEKRLFNYYTFWVKEYLKEELRNKKRISLTQFGTNLEKNGRYEPWQIIQAKTAVSLYQKFKSSPAIESSCSKNNLTDYKSC